MLNTMVQESCTRLAPPLETNLAAAQWVHLQALPPMSTQHSLEGCDTLLTRAKSPRLSAGNYSTFKLLIDISLSAAAAWMHR